MIISSIGVDFENCNSNCLVPAFYIHINGCNMQCINKLDNSLCEYTTSTKAKSISFAQIKKYMSTFPNIHHVVIDGGEPLLYKKDIEKLLSEIWKEGLCISIKTNGTQPILNPLGANYKISKYEVYIPNKNSLPEVGVNYNGIIYGTNEIAKMNNDRININVLSNIAMYAQDYVFHFDIECSDDVQEVEQIINSIYKNSENDEFIKSFFQKYPIEEHISVYSSYGIEIEELQNICFQKGWKYSLKK